MLASDADRDRFLGLLREAYAAGRITIDELSERVTQTLTARTLEELDAVVADLQPERRLRASAPTPGYWYPSYGRGMPRPYRRYRWPFMWLPLVLFGSFFWVPWVAGWHMFFFPFVFFGGFWLFALWRRALRF